MLKTNLSCLVGALLTAAACSQVNGSGNPQDGNPGGEGGDTTSHASGDGDGDGEGDGGRNPGGDGDGDMNTAGANSGGTPGANTDTDTDTDAPGVGGRTTTPNDPPALEIVEDGTVFVDYGTLRITFDREVAVDGLNVALTGTLGPALEVLGLEQISGTVIQAQLDAYHLPIDYEIVVTGQEADETEVNIEFTLDGAGNGARTMFLTKEAGPGDFSSWESASGSNAPGLGAADDVCQNSAEAAGLKGTFVAFLSTNETDAVCRAFGLTGKWSDDCQQTARPADDAPFLSTQGRPIVWGGEGIATTDWRLPVHTYEDGTQADDTWVWHGSSLTGEGSGSTCLNWENATDAARGSAAIALGEYTYASNGSRDCVEELRLLCLQVEDSFFGPSTLHERTGKQVFVSEQQVTGDISFDGKTGAAAADAICQSEADDAGLANASDFVAYLSTTTTDALCRITVGSGQVSDNCGQAALPTAPLWVRTDGYPVGTPERLRQPSTQPLLAPIATLADGTLHSGVRSENGSESAVWTGTDRAGAAAPTCTDWTTASTETTGRAGNLRGISIGWPWYSTPNCSNEYSLYCFER